MGQWKSLGKASEEKYIKFLLQITRKQEEKLDNSKKSILLEGRMIKLR